VAAIVASPAYAYTFGKIKVTDTTAGYDHNMDIYLVGGEWSKNNVQIHGDGRGFTLKSGGRLYFATEAMDSFEGQWQKYWKTELKGNHFSYDIDVS